MAETVNMHQVKSSLSRLVERALAGEEVVIATANRSSASSRSSGSASRACRGAAAARSGCLRISNSPTRKSPSCSRDRCEASYRHQRSLVVAKRVSASAGARKRPTPRTGRRCRRQHRLPLGDRDKKVVGKLRFLEDFEDVITEEAFELLGVAYAHLRVLSDLPQHHRDPFDRLLIAQALAEHMPVVTADPAFAPYGVAVVW